MLNPDEFHSLFDVDRIHRTVYTEPRVFEAEMVRIFSSTWLFVAHESEVPNAGDFKTDSLAGRPVIVTRGDDNKVRVLFNACRHRGAKVCHEPYGNGTGFGCLYHGWRYNTRGEILHIPMQDNFRNLPPDSALGLLSLPRVESFRGFVFASLNPHVPPLLEHLGRSADYLGVMSERAPSGELEVSRPIKYEFEGNWKLQLENYADNYHPKFLHKTALDVGARMMSDKYGKPSSRLKRPDEQKERAFGGGHSATDYGSSRGEMWMDAYKNPDYRQAIRTRHGDEHAQELIDLDLHVIIYPNLLLHVRQSHYRVIKPLAVDHTEVWAYPCKLKGAPKEVNETLVMNTSHHTSAMGEVQVDDLQAFKWVQEGLKSEALDWVLFKLYGTDERVLDTGEVESSGATEAVIRHQYAEWSRLMQADAAASVGTSH